MQRLESMRLRGVRRPAPLVSREAVELLDTHWGRVAAGLPADLEPRKPRKAKPARKVERGVHKLPGGWVRHVGEEACAKWLRDRKARRLNAQRTVKEHAVKGSSC